MDSPSFYEQLMSLKALTLRTGIVHEAQILQLKYWGPLAFGPKVIKDIVLDQDKKQVQYRLKKEPIISQSLAARVVSLEVSIKDMLGGGWVLLVKSGAKVLYSSNQKAKNVRKRLRKKTRKVK